MKTFATLSCAALLAALSLAPGARAQDAPPPAPTDTVELRLRLTAGQTYNVRYDIEQATVQTIRGRPFVIEQTTGTDYQFKVDSLDAAGNARITGTVKAVQWRQDNSSTGEEIYDSRVPGDPSTPGAKSMAALVGTTFTMRVSPIGKVLGVVGMDATFRKVAAAVVHVPAAQRAAMLKQLKEQYGDKAMQQMMDQSMNYLPEKPVRIGDTWKRQAIITGAYPQVMNIVYTLKDRREGASVIEAESTITSPIKGAPMKIDKATISVRLKGKQTGTMEIDETSGWGRSSRLSQSLTGTVTVTGMPGEKKPVSWPITIETQITTQSE